MKTLLAKEARALVAPAVGAIFVYAALAIVITLYSSRGSYTPTLIVGTLLMPLIALLLGSFAFSSGGRQPVAEWESAWPVSRARVWGVKIAAHVVALALVQTVCSAVPTLVILSQQRMVPLALLWRVLPSTWRFIGWGQFCYVLMVLAVALMFAGAMRKSAAALGVATAVVGLLTALYLIAIGNWLPGLFGPALGIAQGYVGTRGVVGCTMLMGAIALWSSLWGTLRTQPLAYQRRLVLTARHAGLLTALALPVFVGLLIWSTAPRQVDLRALAQPVVSPDGRWVAFLGGRTPGVLGGAGAWVIGTDGSGLKCVGRGPVQTVRWLGDSRRLLVTWGGSSALPMLLRRVASNTVPRSSSWVIDSSAGQTDRVPGLTEGGTAMVSPGGKWALAGSRVWQLERPYAARDIGLAKETPVLGWSADETMLLVGDPSFGPNDTISGIDLQSGVKRVLASAPAGPGAPVSAGALALMRRLTGREGGIVHPVPAPEQQRWWVWSNRVVRRTASGMSESVTGTPFAYAVDRQSGQRVSLPGIPLTNGFSPDGRHVWTDKSDEAGVSSSSSQLGPVVVTDLTTGRVVTALTAPQVGRFSTEMREQGSLQWSPDGTRLVCGQSTIDLGDTLRGVGRRYRVWTARADGTGLAELFELKEDRRTAALTGQVTGYTVAGCTVAGWAADGKVVIGDGGQGLVRIDPDTAEKTDLLRLKPSERSAVLRGLNTGGAQVR